MVVGLAGIGAGAAGRVERFAVGRPGDAAEAMHAVKRFRPEGSFRHIEEPYLTREHQGESVSIRAERHIHRPSRKGQIFADRGQRLPGRHKVDALGLFADPRFIRPPHIGLCTQTQATVEQRGPSD